MLRVCVGMTVLLHYAFKARCVIRSIDCWILFLMKFKALSLCLSCWNQLEVRDIPKQQSLCDFNVFSISFQT